MALYLKFYETLQPVHKIARTKVVPRQRFSHKAHVRLGGKFVYKAAYREGRKSLYFQSEDLIFIKCSLVGFDK